MGSVRLLTQPRRGGFLGLSAVWLHRLLLIIPALCALVYPSLLSWLSAGLALVHGSASPNGGVVWGGVVTALTLALAGNAGRLFFLRRLWLTTCQEPPGY